MATTAFTPVTTPTQAALPGMTTAPRDADTCPRCGAGVRHILAGDLCAWPATVTRHPVDRTTALVAIVAGREVYVRTRHHRAADRWRQLDADTIGSAHVAAGDHHPAHVCGHDPPPPPKATAATLPTLPPF